MTNSLTTPAGWYQDPHQPGQLRYWDGATWTGNVHPVVLVAANTGSARLVWGIVLTIVSSLVLLVEPLNLRSAVAAGDGFQAIGGLFFWIAGLTVGIVLWAKGAKRQVRARQALRK